MSFPEVMDLGVFDFWQLLRDAVIYNASQTDKGRTWLQHCYAQEQTEPDRQTLRRLFGGGR